MAEQIPQGWYPDPAGSPYRRWWDGTEWTQHTDEPPAQLGTPASSAPLPYGATYGQASYGQTGYTQAFRPQRFIAPYASFWQRVGAAIIDSLILGIPLALVVLVLFWQDIVDAVETAAASGTPSFDGATTASFILVLVISAIASGTYFTFTIALRGATVGMSALRIQVVDEQGQMPTVGRAFGRWAFVQVFQWLTNLVPFVGGLVWLLDPLWMLWDPEKQTLHDKVAKTWVLQKLPEHTPLQGQPPAQW